MNLINSRYQNIMIAAEEYIRKPSILSKVSSAKKLTKQGKDLDKTVKQLYNDFHKGAWIHNSKELGNLNARITKFVDALNETPGIEKKEAIGLLNFMQEVAHNAKRKSFEDSSITPLLFNQLLNTLEERKNLISNEEIKITTEPSVDTINTSQISRECRNTTLKLLHEINKNQGMSDKILKLLGRERIIKRVAGVDLKEVEKNLKDEHLFETGNSNEVLYRSLWQLTQYLFLTTRCKEVELRTERPTNQTYDSYSLKTTFADKCEPNIKKYFEEALALVNQLEKIEHKDK